MLKAVFKFIFVCVVIIVFLIPGYTFFVSVHNNQEILFNSSSELTSKLYTLFRFCGLYAFTLIWGQIVFGPFMVPLRMLFGPKVLIYHRTEGLFALVFAILHPLLFYSAFLLTENHGNVLNALNEYVGNSVYIYGLFGPIAWTLLITTILTALFARRFKYWRMVHLLNYVVFILVFFHSFKIGSETHIEPLNTLYWVFGLTFIAAVTYRFGYRRIWAKIQENRSVQNPESSN